ncbi:TonB-dependent receptor [Limibacter armeniacum]|uniref:TonB-dependent receptor n=1 Tax=Limibacter armeniacum TaxID=466084 RepID=UPI002FE57741
MITKPKNKLYWWFLLLFLSLTNMVTAQDLILYGKVQAEGTPLPGATVQLAGTQQGVITNAEGVFEIKGVTVGKQVLKVSYIGYRTVLKEVFVGGEKRSEVNIHLQEDLFSMDEVVVTGTRTDRLRSQSPVAVDILTSKIFEATQAACLADGLNYQSGLRVETDCQTCNYTQVRMNGMGGAYTQLLINSRPIFSSLMGLYGLEQIPANMIDRVEVVRGGGSAMYGSSAIAGTINILTKDPEKNAYGLSVNHAVIGGDSHDNVVNFNGSLINNTGNRGMTVFLSHRKRQEFDQNNDGFSELPRIKNFSFGTNAFLKPTTRTRYAISLNAIQEQRDGGDQLDLEPHKRLQSESRDTNILSGNVEMDTKLSDISNLSVYTGLQHTRRSHYTGTYEFPEGYGNTKNTTWQSGAQYNITINNFIGGKNTLSSGLEYQFDDIFDQIEAYNYLIDQVTKQWAVFTQSDWEINEKLTWLAGVRLNKHNYVDGIVATPRTSLLYKPVENLKLRGGFATGFRAPQAFDADMHIAFSGGGINRIQISPDLKPEHSNSYTFSTDFDKPTEHYIYGFTVSGFYTTLRDAFVLEELERTVDGQSQIILEKKNGGNSTVKGLTLEGRANYDQLVEVNLGFTLQESLYDREIVWSENAESSRRYLRTPNQYGFYTLNLMPSKAWSFYISGVYTGPMLVPHYGGSPGVDEDRLVRTDEFWETNLKVTYSLELEKISQIIEFSGGVQNIFNAYQNDFDIGPDRDSNYVYGPAKPRTFYLGVKLKSF